MARSCSLVKSLNGLVSVSLGYQSEVLALMWATISWLTGWVAAAKAAMVPITTSLNILYEIC